MSFGKKIDDKTILANVQRKMMQKGTGSSRITAAVSSGAVTISGSINSEHERRPILRSVGNVQGIRRVIDQLRVDPRKKLME